MSFKCQICKTPQPARTKPHKVVTETRDMQYVNLDVNGNAKISVGFETVREVNMCEKCWIKRFNGYDSIRS